MYKIIALLLLISNPAFADQAQSIKLGQPAPYDGTIMDKEKSEKIRDQLIERDAFEKQNQSYEKSINLYKTNETLYRGENDMLLHQNIDLTKTLNDQRTTSDWVKVGYFVLGIVITAAAVKGAASLK